MNSTVVTNDYSSEEGFNSIYGLSYSEELKKIDSELAIYWEVSCKKHYE